MRATARQLRSRGETWSTADGQRSPRTGSPGAFGAVLLLQQQAGNRAVSELLAIRSGGATVQRTPEPDGSAATGVVGGLTFGFATSLLSYLQGAELGEAAVAGLVAMGVRDENDLTNLIFWARHPEAALRKIGPGETQLAAEWVQIRNGIVRPALQRVLRGGDNGKRGGTSADRDSDGGTPEPSGGGIGADRLGPYGDEEATAFRREVYTRQLERNKQQKKEFFPGLPTENLDTVVDDHRLHVDAAGDARNLLAAARADLAAQQAAGDPDAIKVAWIGIGSAYRDPERDFNAWKNAFNTHYKATADTRAGLKGGAYGTEAVSLMVSRMVKKKAVPGFSNHTRGLAIDFSTKQGEWTFGASSAQSKGWVRTWLHKWLDSNAKSHNFHPYSAEPWHWDHSA